MPTQAQANQAIAITYRTEAHVAHSDILPPYPDTSAMEPDDIKEELDHYEGVKAFALKQADELNSKPDTSVFTIYNNLVRNDRGSYRLSDDEFRISDLKEGKSYIYYTQDGTPKVSSMWLHDEEKKWDVNYEIDTFPEDRKEILGYDCYRMTISEHRTWVAQGYDERQHYDLYVTPALPLPFRAVGVLWQPITDLCALEIMSRNPKHPESYTKVVATGIRTDVSPKVLELPEQYRGLVK
ncbi:MAG: hypothetical protein AB8H12_03095 [Lewinella sp.]